MNAEHGFDDDKKRARAERGTDITHGLNDEKKRARRQAELDEYYEKVHGIKREGSTASQITNRSRGGKGWLAVGLLGAAAAVGYAVANSKPAPSAPPPDDSGDGPPA